MSSLLNPLLSLPRTLGLLPLLRSPHDTHLLCAQRFVRLFAYGSSTIILVDYLKLVGGATDAQAGAFMTLTLLGDVVLSFLLTIFADGVGRRRVLAMGALMMAGSGVVFAWGAAWWWLLLAGVLGVVSPSGNEIGPFRAIEESTLAQLTPKDVRSDVFIWYTLIGTMGAALGNALCGWLVQKLEEGGKEPVDAYRIVFGIYAALGMVKFALTLALSEKVEPEKKETEYRELGIEVDAEGLLSDSEDESERGSTTRPPRTSPPASAPPSTFSKIGSLLPTISPESRRIVIKLCALFAVDSLASGLATPTWITYFFTSTFHLAPSVLGTLFFTTNIVASISNLLAAPLARHIGLVKTMVFTHLPSAIFLALIPLPSQAWLAMTFLVLRASIQSMDQAPRQAFLAAAVLPAERTAVMGAVNVVKTLAQSGGPSITGWLAGSGRFWTVFVSAGLMKAGYDLALLKMFLGFEGREGE